MCIYCSNWRLIVGIVSGMYGAGFFLKIGNGRRFEFPTECQWLYGWRSGIFRFSAWNRSIGWSHWKLMVGMGGGRYVAGFFWKFERGERFELPTERGWFCGWTDGSFGLRTSNTFTDNVKRKANGSWWIMQDVVWTGNELDTFLMM